MSCPDNYPPLLQHKFPCNLIHTLFCKKLLLGFQNRRGANASKCIVHCIKCLNTVTNTFFHTTYAIPRKGPANKTKKTNTPNFPMHFTLRIRECAQVLKPRTELITRHFLLILTRRPSWHCIFVCELIAQEKRRDAFHMRADTTLEFAYDGLYPQSHFQF